MRIYVNDVAVDLKFTLDEEEPVTVAEIVMAKSFVPTLIELLKKS